MVEFVKEALLPLLVGEGPPEKMANRVAAADQKPMSYPKKQQKFLQHLAEMARSVGSWVFSMDELRNVAQGLQLGVDDFQLFVERLNLQNHLLKKPNNRYELAKMG
jgi:hypothetical protein